MEQENIDLFPRTHTHTHTRPATDSLTLTRANHSQEKTTKTNTTSISSGKIMKERGRKRQAAAKTTIKNALKRLRY